MARKSMPEHQKLDFYDPMKVRAPAAHREVWGEVASELKMTDAAFARSSLLLVLNAIAEHDPALLARAVKRANRALTEQGFPPITLADALTGAGLPEHARLLITPQEIEQCDKERPCFAEKFNAFCKNIIGIESK